MHGTAIRESISFKACCFWWRHFSLFHRTLISSSRTDVLRSDINSAPFQFSTWISPSRRFSSPPPNSSSLIRPVPSVPPVSNSPVNNSSLLGLSPSHRTSHPSPSSSLPHLSIILWFPLPQPQSPQFPPPAVSPTSTILPQEGSQPSPSTEQ